MSSVGSEAGSEGSLTSKNGEIVITGYLKKLKTMKKKFFVLRAESTTLTACLEYYDSGKKWKNNHPPKRMIILRKCFSINRRSEVKGKLVIGLFSGSDCFGIVFENEDELHEWFRLLLIHHQGEDITDISCPKPYYEHVWRITIQKKELASKHNLSGIYFLCLTDSTLSLVKHVVDSEHESKFYEFSLQSIRRCGNLDAFFYMEVGQASCLGPGNLWLNAEDPATAHNMHSVIMNACTSCPKKEMPPISRSRSSSANEASKPIYFGRKWPSGGDDALSILSCTKLHSHQDHAVSGSNFISQSDTGRERCDSLPTRSRLMLDSLSGCRNGNNASYAASANSRPHSMYNRGVFSPTGCSHPTSPMSTTYSNDSDGSSLSVDADNENWSETGRIIEESPSEYVQWGGANQNRNFLAENIPHSNNVCRNMKSIFPHSNSNSQSSCSPCSSSPMDAGAYIPMSPESAADSRNRPQLNRSYDSVNHSRESSIHEDIAEGYVPMAPLSVDAGYISMDQSGRKQGDLSSGLSSCSITSGTPSTDVRFSEFHLDKVSSYFTPSEEDIVFNVRQTRAYSTGSKPDTLHSKFIGCDSADGLRARAFSVGSRCPKTLFNMPPTPRRNTPASTSTSSIEPCDDLMEMDFSANKLRNHHLRSRVKHHQRHTQKSGVVHTSGELPTMSHGVVANSFSHPIVTDGYMDMSPKSSPKLVDSFNDSRISSSDSNLSPPRLSKHLLGRSSPANGTTFSKQAFSKGSPSSGTNMLEKVLEMELMAHAKRSASANADHSEEDCSYMDMKPGVCDMPDVSTPKSAASAVTAPMVIAVAASTVTPNLYPRKDSFSLNDSVAVFQTPATITTTSSYTTTTLSTPSSTNVPHIKQPLLDTNGKQLKKVDAKMAATSEKCSTPDGYVDMTFKGRAKVVASSDGGQQSTKMVAKIPDKTPDGYVDMSFKDAHARKNLVDSNSALKNKVQQQLSADSVKTSTPSCCSGKENQQVSALMVVVEMQQRQLQQQRQCSKPIAIQTPKNKRSNSGGTGFFRRKLSGDETQQALKPNFLPLVHSTFASLGRKKKGAQKKEKTGAPAESPVNAGGAATMFPLSPDRVTVAAISPSSASLDYDPNSKCAITASGESVRLMADFEIRSLERVDKMVNWDRRDKDRHSGGGNDDDSENSVYIMMTPGVVPRLERKVSEPMCGRRSYLTRNGDDVGRTLQRCTSVPSTMGGGGARSWNRCTSVPEVINVDGPLDTAKCCGSGTSDSDSSSTVTSCSVRANYSTAVTADDRLCQRAPVDACQPQVTQCHTDVPKTCAAPAIHVRDSDKVMYATLDLPPSNEDLPKNDSIDTTKLANQSILTYAQIDFEKPPSSSSPCK